MFVCYPTDSGSDYKWNDDDCDDNDDDHGNYNNNLMVRRLIEGQGLSTDCWPQAHMSADRDETASSQFMNDV